MLLPLLDPCARPRSGAAARRAASAKKIADTAMPGQDLSPLPLTTFSRTDYRLRAAAPAIDRAVERCLGTAPEPTSVAPVESAPDLGRWGQDRSRRARRRCRWRADLLRANRNRRAAI